MPFTRISIKYLLLLIVLVVTIPTVGIIINTGLQQRREAIRAAKIETQKLADSIASEQKNLVASTMQLFISLSQLPELQERDRTKVETILSQIHKLSPQYVLIFVADTSGTIWASSIPSKNTISIADRRYFRNALATGRLSSGEYAVGRTTNKATFNFGYPVKDAAGKITDVLCVGIALDYYKHVLDTSTVHKNANFSLIDHAGIVLYRAVEAANYTGKPVDQGVFRHMQAGPETETSLGKSSIAGDKRFQTYRKLRLEGETDPYMYIRAGIPASSVMVEANANLIRNMSIYSAFLLMAFIFSWLLGKRYIIDRLDGLRLSSQRLAEGDLSARVSEKAGGGELGVLGRTFDAMAEKVASREAALASSERFLNTIINTDPECITVLDAEGRITLMNNAGLAIIQAVTFNEVRSLGFSNLILEPYREGFVRLFEEVLQGAHGTFTFELIGFNARHVWLESHMVPFRNEAGVITSVLNVSRDITEQRETEKQNRLLAEQLNQNQKVESIGRLAGGIAHDLNNLLTPIIGYSDMLKSEFEPASKAAHRLENICLASDRARTLIQQLLSFSRKQVLRMKIVDMNQLIISFYDILRRTIRENIEIDLNLTREDLYISADTNQIEQIIMNLVVNAQDAIHGNGHITIETAEEYLDERFVQTHVGAKAGRHLMLSISDDGCGMDKETREMIFEPFFTTKGVGHGTGLGLSTVYGIVKQHGGSIWVSSEADTGTTFKIYFPIVDDLPEQDNRKKPQRITLKEKYNVLLVEDNPMVREMACDLLIDSGLNVTSADSPEKALQICAEETFDLLISDIIMPGMTGPEMYAKLILRQPELRVIFMSGYSRDVISQQVLLDERHICIQKPFNSTVIMNHIEKIMAA